MLNDLSREQQLIILGLVLLIIAGLAVMIYRNFASNSDPAIVIEEPAPRQSSGQAQRTGIIVHITGGVVSEGVYKLETGDRVIDVLNLAGGAGPRADLSLINLAEKVKDGQKIIVPVKQKVVQRVLGNSDTRGAGTSSGKVSLNTASEKELCKVTGIGPTTAKKIIEYRTSNGPFAKLEDVMKVKSIGKSKFNKIQNNICL